MTDIELHKCLSEVARQIVLETYDKNKYDTDLKLSDAVCDLALLLRDKVFVYKEALNEKQELEKRINEITMTIPPCCENERYKSLYDQLRLDLNRLHEINQKKERTCGDCDCAYIRAENERKEND